jgi:hypothetical protein
MVHHSNLPVKPCSRLTLPTSETHTALTNGLESMFFVCVY